MKIKTKKDPLKPKNGKKSTKYGPNNFLSEFRPIMNFDADVKNYFKIYFLPARGPKGPYMWP